MDFLADKRTALGSESKVRCAQLNSRTRHCAKRDSARLHQQVISMLLRKVGCPVAAERDFNAERITRIEMLMAEARHLLTTPAAPKDRHEMRTRLQLTLKELGARVPIEMLRNFSTEN